jgi:hypothetical protein
MTTSATVQLLWVFPFRLLLGLLGGEPPSCKLELDWARGIVEPGASVTSGVLLVFGGEDEPSLSAILFATPTNLRLFPYLDFSSFTFNDSNISTHCSDKGEPERSILFGTKGRALYALFSL